MMDAHIGNFLSCMRTREKPHLDVETGAKAVVVINLAAQSLSRRQDHVLGREALEGFGQAGQGVRRKRLGRR